MPVKLGKLSSGHRAGKRSVFIPIPKKGMPKNVQTTTQLHSYASKFGKLSSGHRTEKG